MIIGTPDYISPEQAEGVEADHRSDIYSLGVILYEMVTGTVPFEGDTALSVALKHKSQMPMDPRKLNPGISGDLSRLILICMEKDRERRYQTAEAVLADLHNIGEGLPLGTKIKPGRETFVATLIRKKLFVPVLSIALILIAVVILQFLLPKISAPPLSRKLSLAVMYFENRSGMPDLDKVLVEMMITNLGRYEEIEVVSSQRLFDILKQMEKPDIETIDKKTATEVALKAGVQAMLLGSIMKIGDKVIINSHLTDAESGSIIDSAQAEGGNIENDIFGMVDKLTAEIGSNLGVYSKGKDQGLKITDVSTDSLQAYRYYQKGLQEMYRFKFTDAAANFQKAVDIDSSFATAYLWMGWSQAGMGMALANPYRDITPIKSSMAQAKQYSQKTTEKEELLIDIGSALIDFDTARAKTCCQKLVAKYPKEKLGYHFLGFSYLGENEFEKAREAYEKELELDPTDANTYWSLAYSNAWMKDQSAAVSAAKKYIAVFPDVFNTYDSAWEIHLMFGLYDEAQRFLEEALNRNPNWSDWVQARFGMTHLFEQDFNKAREKFRWFSKNIPLYSSYMGFIYFIEGKYQKAASEIRRVLDSAQKAKDIASEMRTRFRLGIILTAQREYDEAIDEYSEAEQLSNTLFDENFNPYSLLAHHLTGIALVYKGDYEAARDRADLIRSTIQRGNYTVLHSNYYHLLLGELFVAQNKPEAAQDELDKMPKSLTLPRYKKLAAVIDCLQGRFEEAADKYQNYFKYRQSNLGSMDFFDFLEQHSKLDYNLAKIYEQMGETKKASAHYEKFLDLWKEADPGIPEFEEAKKTLAALKN